MIYSNENDKSNFPFFHFVVVCIRVDIVVTLSKSKLIFVNNIVWFPNVDILCSVSCIC